MTEFQERLDDVNGAILDLEYPLRAIAEWTEVIKALSSSVHRFEPGALARVADALSLEVEQLIDSWGALHTAFHGDDAQPAKPKAPPLQRSGERPQSQARPPRREAILPRSGEKSAGASRL